MQKFEILFDRAPEHPAVADPAFELYGPLGFPEPPDERPWIYTNFAQSLDGMVSFRGKHASGGDISGSAEDRWLMDLLRAHADAVMVGLTTLIAETEMTRDRRPRGPVFRIMDPDLRSLRKRLGRRREMNIIVTGGLRLRLSDYRLFDGDYVDAVVLTTRRGAAHLQEQGPPPHVRILSCGEGDRVPLEQATQMLRRELDLRYLLCEGGPTLYGWLSRAGLVDEKFLTVAPVEIGQLVPPEQEPTVGERTAVPVFRPTVFNAPGFLKETAPHWHWLSCRRVGDQQFSRYRRVRQ